MNRSQADILSALLSEPFINQKVLSETTGYPLTAVNKGLKQLISDGYLKEDLSLTSKAREYIRTCTPKNAIILAAGFGMRMAPINLERPKALLEIDGETLIERVIHQLHDVGITDITIVVGFLKEQFDFLAEKYGVELIANDAFAKKNNLHSLALAADRISNTYILCGDLWCLRNPFRRREFYSWYMVSNLVDDDSNVRLNRNLDLIKVPAQSGGNSMIGIAYLTGEAATAVKRNLLRYDADVKYDDSFWEETLYKDTRVIVPGRMANASDIIEINTYEQLRELNDDSDQLKSDAIDRIVSVFNVDASEIVNIAVIKKGMTNRSFSFSCRGKRYIMRIPGEGSDQLINRRQEAEVYNTIAGLHISDELVFIDPENGYKITEFVENARTCDAHNSRDLKACMKKLREFHALDLKVHHEFDLFGQIDFYESLWKGKSIYKDYKRTKENVFSLKKYIDEHVERKCLTHIDPNADNFLFAGNGDLKLIDWEYAGMQDPHVDIAMFAIYSMFNKRQIDRLIDIYFENNCPRETRLKIYCYVAVCGLLWSNWCEYKRDLGVEFEGYALAQYKYAGNFYKHFQEALNEG